MLKNRISALLAQHSIQRPEVSDLYGKAGKRWLRALVLEEADGSLLREDVGLLELLQERIKLTEKLLRESAHGGEAVRWLRSIPGIGEFFSVLIRYEVDDIGRFRHAKQFAAYTGLVPSTDASGKAGWCTGD